MIKSPFHNSGRLYDQLSGQERQAQLDHLKRKVRLALTALLEQTRDSLALKPQFQIVMFTNASFAFAVADHVPVHVEVVVHAITDSAIQVFVAAQQPTATGVHRQLMLDDMQGFNNLFTELGADTEAEFHLVHPVEGNALLYFGY